MIGQRVADAALALVGTAFRLNGRDVASGIDCIGLVELSLRAAGCPGGLPVGYQMRTRSEPLIGAIARTCGLVEVGGQLRTGDIVVVRPGPCQLHVLIFVGARGYVHAHAGLRLVAILPAPPDWPELARFRPVSDTEEPIWRP